jgi:hypothetical protein
MMTVISEEALCLHRGRKEVRRAEGGFNLTYAMLQMNAAGQGRGEMAPASNVKWMESGAPARRLRKKQVVWLDDVTKVDQP